MWRGPARPHAGEAAVYAAKALEPAAAPCEGFPSATSALETRIAHRAATRESRGWSSASQASISAPWVTVRWPVPQREITSVTDVMGLCEIAFGSWVLCPRVPRVINEKREAQQRGQWLMGR